jgi:hypothetical protein
MSRAEPAEPLRQRPHEPPRPLRKLKRGKLASSQLQSCSKSLTDAGRALYKGFGLETKHPWPSGQPPDEGSSVSIPEECASANPPTKMKNMVFPRSMSRRRPSHRSFRSTVAQGQGGFFNLRALLGLTVCFLGLALGIFAARESLLRRVSEPPRYMPVPGGNLQGEAAGLAQLEQYWHDRLTYPTGRFDPAWGGAPAPHPAPMKSGVPAGQKR